MDPPFLTRRCPIAHAHYSTSDLTAIIRARLREARSLLERERSRRCGRKRDEDNTVMKKTRIKMKEERKGDGEHE
jgi:hypothetical protein